MTRSRPRAASKLERSQDSATRESTYWTPLRRLERLVHGGRGEVDENAPVALRRVADRRTRKLGRGRERVLRQRGPSRLVRLPAHQIPPAPSNLIETHTERSLEESLEESRRKRISRRRISQETHTEMWSFLLCICDVRGVRASSLRARRLPPGAPNSQVSKCVLDTPQLGFCGSSSFPAWTFKSSNALSRARDPYTFQHTLHRTPRVQTHTPVSTHSPNTKALTPQYRRVHHAARRRASALKRASNGLRSRCRTRRTRRSRDASACHTHTRFWESEIFARARTRARAFGTRNGTYETRSKGRRRGLLPELAAAVSEVPPGSSSFKAIITALLEARSESRESSSASPSVEQKTRDPSSCDLESLWASAQSGGEWD